MKNNFTNYTQYLTTGCAGSLFLPEMPPDEIIYVKPKWRKPLPSELGKPLREQEIKDYIANGEIKDDIHNGEIR